MSERDKRYIGYGLAGLAGALKLRDRYLDRRRQEEADRRSGELHDLNLQLLRGQISDQERARQRRQEEDQAAYDFGHKVAGPAGGEIARARGLSAAMADFERARGRPAEVREQQLREALLAQQIMGARQSRGLGQLSAAQQRLDLRKARRDLMRQRQDTRAGLAFIDENYKDSPMAPYMRAAARSGGLEAVLGAHMDAQDRDFDRRLQRRRLRLDESREASQAELRGAQARHYGNSASAHLGRVAEARKRKADTDREISRIRVQLDKVLDAREDARASRSAERATSVANLDRRVVQLEGEMARAMEAQEAAGQQLEDSLGLFQAVTGGHGTGFGSQPAASNQRDPVAQLEHQLNAYLKQQSLDKAMALLENTFHQGLISFDEMSDLANRVLGIEVIAQPGGSAAIGVGGGGGG